MWDDRQFADGRLRNTVVRTLEGEPIYIDGFTDEGKLSFHHLKTNKPSRITFKENCIDISPVKLGYLNIRGGSYYAVRVPKRRWKQGLDGSSGGYLNDGKINGINFLEYTDSLYDTIMGIYPSLPEVVKYVKSKGGTQAFDRKFALKQLSGENQFRLYYKGSAVGKLAGKDLKVTFNKDCEFLEESYEEAVQ